MRDLDVMAVYIRELHEVREEGEVCETKMHGALVAALDDLGLGVSYRSFHDAMGGDATLDREVEA